MIKAQAMSPEEEREQTVLQLYHFRAEFDRITCEVRAERIRQNQKFTKTSYGAQYHDIFTWLTILSEETGESANAALEVKFGKDSVAHLREELVQSAAVIFAIIERIDANEGELFPNEKAA